jgi:hypothetical protein
VSRVTNEDAVGVIVEPEVAEAASAVAEMAASPTFGVRVKMGEVLAATVGSYPKVVFMKRAVVGLMSAD